MTKKTGKPLIQLFLAVIKLIPQYRSFLFKKFSESNTSVASSQFEASPDTVSTQQFLSSFFQPNYANVRLSVFLSLVLVEKFLQRQLLFHFPCKTFVLVFI